MHASATTRERVRSEVREFHVNMIVFSERVFACVFGKRGLVLIITSKIELEISRPLCKGFYRKKEFEKGPRDALRLLRE